VGRRGFVARQNLDRQLVSSSSNDSRLDVSVNG